MATLKLFTSVLRDYNLSFIDWHKYLDIICETKVHPDVLDHIYHQLDWGLIIAKYPLSEIVAMAAKKNYLTKQHWADACRRWVSSGEVVDPTALRNYSEFIDWKIVCYANLSESTKTEFKTMIEAARTDESQLCPKCAACLGCCLGDRKAVGDFEMI